MGREKSKGRQLIKGELSNQLLRWVPGGEFPRETLRNGAKHSVRILSSDRQESWGILYASPRELEDEEERILIPQNQPADYGQSGLGGATLRNREAGPQLEGHQSRVKGPRERGGG